LIQGRWPHLSEPIRRRLVTVVVAILGIFLFFGVDAEALLVGLRVGAFEILQALLVATVVSAAFVVLFVLAIVAAVLTQLLMVVLLMLGFVPPLRGLVLWMQLRMATALGDRYVLVLRPVGLNALVTGVRS